MKIRPTTPALIVAAAAAVSLSLVSAGCITGPLADVPDGDREEVAAQLDEAANVYNGRYLPIVRGDRPGSPDLGRSFADNNQILRDLAERIAPPDGDAQRPPGG